jgi:hypothetical protein
MKITLQGWSRDHGPRVLIDRQFNDKSIHLKDDRQPVYFSKNSIRVDKGYSRGQNPSKSGIRISFHADIIANGSYLFQLHLSQQELLQLIPDSIGDMTVRELSTFLSKTEVRSSENGA